MRKRFRINTMLPPGPVFSIMLVGSLLVSGLLYYRAVNIQRYVEPALALSLPRSELARHLAEELVKEFGATSVPGIRLRSSSLIIEKALLFSPDGSLRRNAPAVLRKLGRVYRSLLDDEMRLYVGMIFVIVRYPLQEDPSGTRRTQQQRDAWKVLDLMLSSELGLWNKIGHYFGSAAIPAYQMMQSPNSIEIQIIPSERMHTEVFMKLTKYLD